MGNFLKGIFHRLVICLISQMTMLLVELGLFWIRKAGAVTLWSPAF